MDKSFVEATGKCSKCGGDLQTADDNTTDESIVVCAGCGAKIGTHGEVNAQMRKVALDKAREVIDAGVADLKRSIGNKTINIKIR